MPGGGTSAITVIGPVEPDVRIAAVVVGRGCRPNDRSSARTGRSLPHNDKLRGERSMKLQTIRLSNFQSFGAAPTDIRLEEITYLIGPNGSGKTAALQALNRPGFGGGSNF